MDSTLTPEIIPDTRDDHPDGCMTTYQRADGELWWGEYGWVTETDGMEDEVADMGQEGVVVVKEEWVRTTREVVRYHPEECANCEKPWHGTTCDEEPA